MTARGSYEQRCQVCGVDLTREVEFLGEIFVLADNPRKRYCSQRCKQRRYRERLDERDQSQGFPSGFTAKRRNAERSRSERHYMDRSLDAGCWCATCGTRIPESARADKRYCSPACRQDAYRQRDR